MSTEDNRPSEWQPIETAPKDGSKFLAVWPETGYDPRDIDVTYWEIDVDFKGWASGNYRAHTDDVSPTHWMPIPKLPEEEDAR